MLVYQGLVFKVSFNQHMYWTPRTLQAPSLEPRLAQGLLQGLDDEAGGIWLHIHFGLAVPGLHQAGCFQHHGGLGVIKSKVSLRAGEGSTIFSMHKMMAMIMS